MKSFLLSFCPKKLKVAKIILVHLLQGHELLKTGARVVARRKRQIVRALSELLRKWLEGKAGALETSAELYLNDGNGGKDRSQLTKH